MVDPLKFPAVPVRRWAELHDHLVVVYSSESDGAVSGRDGDLLDVGLVEDGPILLGTSDEGTFGIALKDTCEFWVVDNRHRPIAMLDPKSVEQVPHGGSTWSSAEFKFQECAVEVIRKAENRHWPIQGKIVRADHDRYHVDLGMDLMAFLPVKRATGLVTSPEKSRRRFFTITHVDKKAREVEVALWSGRFSPGKAADLAPRSLPKLGGYVPKTPSFSQELSLALAESGSSLSLHPEADEVERAAEAFWTPSRQCDDAAIAVTAVASARSRFDDSPGTAIGILQLAEWELARRVDQKRLAFVQVELAKLMHAAGRLVSAKLYAQAGARRALAVNAAKLAQTAIELLEGWGQPTARRA